MKPTREDKARNRDEVIQIVFLEKFTKGASEVVFGLNDIRRAIAKVQRTRPEYVEENEYDVRYQYTSGRRPFPASIEKHGPWMIAGKGKGKYAFVKLAESPSIT